MNGQSAPDADDGERPDEPAQTPASAPAARRQGGDSTGASRRAFLYGSLGAGIGATVLGSGQAAAAGPPDVDPENFHVYLLFGQSNMEGQGEIQPKDRETNSRVHVLADKTCPNLGREYGNWYVAEPPLNRCNFGLGPGDYFGKRMAQELPEDHHIGLVPAAVSGADIAVFEKGAPIGAGDYSVPKDFAGGYAWLLDLAQRAQEVGTIEGVLFHQGETNTGQQSWPGTVREIVGDLRSDLGIGEVPFLAGEVLYGGCCDAHNPLVNQLPEVIPNAHVVSAEGLAGKGDDAHFSTEAYRELGRRYAEKLLEVRDAPSGPCADAAGGSVEVDGRTVCDVNGDGLYRDLDGNGEVSHADVQAFFSVQHRPAWKQPDRFDFNDNDVVGHGDVVSLFEDVATSSLT